MRRKPIKCRSTDYVEPGALRAPGHIGRLVRLALGFACVWFLVELAHEGPIQIAARFPYVDRLWLWAIPALYLFSYVVNIGFGKSWGRWPQYVVIVCALAASIISYVTYFSFWGLPLAWFIIIWLSYVYVHLGLSFVLAAILATPGCEMRALPQLLAMISDRPFTVHYCPVGPLSRIDAWEAKIKIKGVGDK